MAKRVSADRWLFTVSVCRVFVGWVMVFSASAVIAKGRYGSGSPFLFRQLAGGVRGIKALLAAMKLDYRRYKHPAVVFSVLGITTLMLISVFFLDRTHHTHRWIHWGSFSFQPSEIAKPALILFLAFFLECRTRSIDDWRDTLLPAIIPTAAFLGLIIFQPDLGTAIACAAITGSVLFVAGLRLRYLGYALLASLAPLYFLIFHVAYRRDRILAFLDPYSDPQGRGFHIIQSLIAVSTGGITGLGLMEGKQKLFYLPEPHTDFIFAVTAEELGLVGALVIIALFAVFLWRGGRPPPPPPKIFWRTLSVGKNNKGVGGGIIYMNVGFGLLPTQSNPPPSFSFGGSSLFVTLACVGVLLNISKQAD